MADSNDTPVVVGSGGPNFGQQLWSQQVAQAEADYGVTSDLEKNQPVIYEFAAGTNKRRKRNPYA